MRGKLILIFILIFILRITPAHAGKTDFLSSLIKFSQDHPRACGENKPHALTMPPMQGSPPRMRGKLAFRAEGDRYVRITPAHAGKTCYITSTE